jgi:hypothetical protein
MPWRSRGHCCIYLVAITKKIVGQKQNGIMPHHDFREFPEKLILQRQKTRYSKTKCQKVYYSCLPTKTGKEITPYTAAAFIVSSFVQSHGSVYFISVHWFISEIQYLERWPHVLGNVFAKSWDEIHRRLDPFMPRGFGVEVVHIANLHQNN